MYVDKKQKSLILCFYSPLGTEIMINKFTRAKWLIPVSIAWSEWEYYHCPLSIAKLTPSISSGFPDNSLAPGYTPGWREVLWEESVLPKNTTTWPGLEPGPVNPGVQNTHHNPIASSMMMMIMNGIYGNHICELWIKMWIWKWSWQ